MGQLISFPDIIMKNFLLSILLLCIFFNLEGANVIRRSLKIFPTAEKITIDGKANERVWQETAHASNLMLRMKNGEKAKEKTEFIMTYDAEYLYCFFKMYESNINGLKQGPPPDVHDKIQENEAVYLYLNPGKNLNGFFVFGASPMGAKLDKMLMFDRKGLPGLNYNCYNWQLKTGRFDGGWSVETAIPLTELAVPGKFNGTPETGEKWSFNVQRIRSQGENSQYSLTGSSENNYGCFGNLIFEHRNGTDFADIQINVPDFRIGQNELSVSSRNIIPNDIITLQISKNDKIVKTQKLNTGKNIFTISDVGDYKLTVTVERKNKTVYKSVLRTKIIDKKSEIAKIFTEIRQVKAQNELAANNDFRKLFRLMSENSADYDTVTKLYQQLKYPVFLNNIKLQHDIFAAFAVSPDKIIKNFHTPETELIQKAKLNLAGNEMRSIQLLLISASDKDENIELEFKSNAAVKYRFFEILPDKRTEIPDILNPVKSVTVRKGGMKSIWLDVIPDKQYSSGNFNGSIILKNNRKTVNLPIEITLFPFALPQGTTLRHNHWLRYPVFKTYVTPEIYEKSLNTLSLYRSAPFYFDVSPLRKLVKFSYSSKNGFSCDFSALDPYFELGKKYHANAYWSAMSCNVGSLTTFVNKKTPVFNKDTNQPVKLYDIPEMRQWIDSYAKGKTHFKTNPELAIIQATAEDNERIYFDTNALYKAYLRDMCAYLSEKNMLENSYYEIYDEAPQLEQRWLDMIKHCTFLKKEFPQLRILNFEVNPTQIIAGKSAVGICDVWAPQLDQCSVELVKNIHSRIKNNPAEEFWFYTCRETVRGENEYTPYVICGRPNIGARIIPYFAWLYKVNGFHINDFAYQKLVVWNGTELLPTMRLAMLRDGMADYEYFALLQSMSKKYKNKLSAQLLKKINNELQIEPQIIKSLYHWTKSSELLDNKKMRLASLINQILKEI